MKYDSAVKKIEIMSFASNWMDADKSISNKVFLTEKD